MNGVAGDDDKWKQFAVDYSHVSEEVVQSFYDTPVSIKMLYPTGEMMQIVLSYRCGTEGCTDCQNFIWQWLYELIEKAAELTGIDLSDDY